MNGNPTMKTSLALTTFCAAMSIVAINIDTSQAQTSPEDYRYCSLDHSGATVCYFNSRADCARSGSGRCIDNPLYNGVGDAMARETLRYHKRRP